MRKSDIAAQLYTLRDYTKTPEQIVSTLERVRSIGYQAVQLSGIGQIEPMNLKSITDRLGIVICATHTAYDRLIGDLDAVIKEHQLLKCCYVGLGAMPVKFRKDAYSYREFMRIIDPIARELADKGLKFVYHNHHFEFEKYNGITGMEILLHETDPAVFSFELDTYWVQSGGANPVDWIRKMSGRIDVIHFKDMSIIDNQQAFAEIGEGNLNWSDIIVACRESHIKWYAVEQDRCYRDPFESMEISFKYLSEYSGED